MLDERINGDLSTSGRSSPIVLQHLRYAVSAAEHGSFRRAAEALSLRQSTLSRCVRQLEDSIGLIVFDQFSGGVRPTQAGQEFLRDARSILEQVDALAATAHKTGRGEAGRLAIGFYTSLSAGNLRATLTDVAQRFPLLEIELVESSRKRLATGLRDGGVDIAIVPGAAPVQDCMVMSLWSERLFAAIPDGHPLVERQAVYWIDLKDETVLLSRRDPGPELHDLLIARTASPGDRPKIVRHDVSRGSLMSLVGAGFGITLLTEASAGATIAGVIYREVREGAEPARISYSAHWGEDNQNPALTSFLKVLGERYPLPAAEV